MTNTQRTLFQIGAVILVFLGLSIFVLANSCIPNGGGGFCKDTINFPDSIVVSALIWTFLGIPSIFIVLLIALFVDIRDKAKRAGPGAPIFESLKEQANATLVDSPLALEPSIIAEPTHKQEPAPLLERREMLVILEASEVRQRLATAAKIRVHSAQTDPIHISRFFNAIRYGQTAQVRKAISANPLIVLAKDAYGNSVMEVATQEKNSELLAFFEACLMNE